jgi:hypothetical protein
VLRDLRLINYIIIKNTGQEPVFFLKV